MEIKKNRICSDCKIKKSMDDFTRDKNDPSGRTYNCKICRALKYKAYRLANPEKVKQTNLKNTEKRKLFYSSEEGKKCSRKAHLKRMYKISIEDYENKLTEQNHKCAICNQENTYDRYGVLAVDHCHVTNKIRGLLCYKCNVGLGNFNDNIQLLNSAINYLTKYKL